jgi:sialate O-acetylesterase
LPGIFDSNMLVQRNLPVRIWGQSPPQSTVRVRFGPRQASTTAGPEGTWQVSLDPVEAGGPYELTVRNDSDSITLTNMLCGDLWLCSGQSNMQLPVKEADPAEQAMVLIGRPNLRLCSVAKSSSAKPLVSAKMPWRLCTPDSARDFSAIGFFFACELLQDPALAKVPIGVVDSSFGGTTCEGWIPEPALGGFRPTDLHDSLFGIKPATLYNAMIAPLGHTSFKGAVWYQGESNSAHPETYPALLATMIDAWRQQFAQPDLPFLIVQLPDYASLWEGFYWPWIREKQAEAVQRIPHTALVVSLGTTDGFNLHPPQKREIGRRAALLARRMAYGEDILASGPVFQRATITGPAIRVAFDTKNDGLARSAADGPKGFAVAGRDGAYHFADARIEGDSVVVQSQEVSEPQTVRYAWAGMPQATLVNHSGLPAAPFRTDSQPYANVEIQKQQLTHRVATATYEIVIDANGMPTSLLFHGAQFLSNEPGAAGGGSIPGFWGPEPLDRIQENGPDLLTCSDAQVTLQMAFADKSMNWLIQNRGKEPTTFQLALSPFVQVTAPLVEGVTTLARGNNSVTVAGFDGLTNTPTGNLLSCRIQPGATQAITLK